ncbi:MAG TPA: LysR substrate-binding domain-containing protein [Rubrivivax sp.]
MKDPSRLPPLDLLASFESAARHLSFTRAGAERFVTQSAMSRQIRALEDDLGVALFRRTHRALVLTPDGQRLQASCSKVMAQLRETVAQIRAPLRREVLSLTTTPGLASLWLIPRLPQFTKAHPGIDVRLDASHDKRDLASDGFDLAIRYLPVGDLEGQPLFAEAIQPVCSPALLKKGAGPALRQPADLAGHTLLQLMPQPGSGMPLDWAPWLQAAGVADLEPAATLSFNGYNEVIEAALAGQGVALGRRPLIDGLIKRRQLVAPFKGATASTRAYRVVVEPSARARPAVSALEQWLLSQAQEESR